ncbi:MAG: hypothetical protein JXQ90_23420 [Cyclobacteriaceae bacterium]
MKSPKNLKVICFLDNPTGRDAEIIIPLAYCFEKYLSADVRVEFIWNAFMLTVWKPHAVILPNTRGHNLYVEIAQTAKKMNMVVLAHESEGNFIELEDYNFWSYNKEKLLIQEWLTTWSEHKIEYTEKQVAEEEAFRVVHTGGIGFDRYRICKFVKERNRLAKKFNIADYKLIIGYAGWAFGKIHGDFKELSHTKIYPNEPEKRYQWVEDQRVYVRDILEKTIQSNPDMLFLLKKHPKESFESETSEGPNEMNELLHYPNVYYIKNEELIHNLINICDLWMGFETTTCMEAWMMGKETVLINQTDDFPRANQHKGSVKIRSYDQISKLLKNYHLTGKVEDFYKPELSTFRRDEINKSIGWSDGKNHLRAFFYFANTVLGWNKSIIFGINWKHLRLYLLMNIGQYFYNKRLFKKLPKFKKTIYVFENRSMEGYHQRKNEYYSDLKDFHKKHDVSSDFLKDSTKILGHKFQQSAHEKINLHLSK